MINGFDLPEGWAVVALRDVGTIITGNTPPKKESDNYGGEIPWAKPPDLNRDAPINTTEEYLSPKGARKARLLPPGATFVVHRKPRKGWNRRHETRD